MSNPLNTTPTADGQELTFYPDASPTQFSTRFYYVNGINTDGSGHRDVAEVIANTTNLYRRLRADAGIAPF